MRNDQQERLVLYLAGELGPDERIELETALRDDAELREEIEALRRTFEMVGESTPDKPGEAYWRTFWSRLQPNLHRKTWWEKFVEAFAPRSGLRLAAVFGTMAAVFVLTVFMLYQFTVTQRPEVTVRTSTIKIKRTEGFFEMAAGDYLERSRLLLLEVVNIAGNGPPPIEQVMDNRRRSEELLSENRSFRIAAEKEEDERLASLLNELEIVLMDIANIDLEVAQEALANLKRRIEKKELLEKFETVSTLREPEDRLSEKKVM